MSTAAQTPATSQTPDPGADHAAGLAATGASSADPVEQYLSGLRDGDIARCAATLAPDIWFRVLLPRKTLELTDAADVDAKLRYWFEEPSECELIDSERHELGSRTHLRYCLRIRPQWDPENVYLAEQSGYARIKDGKLARLDLVCTGFHLA
jgi:hypothetical protein